MTIKKVLALTALFGMARIRREACRPRVESGESAIPAKGRERQGVSHRSAPTRHW